MIRKYGVALVALVAAAIPGVIILSFPAPAPASARARPECVQISNYHVIACKYPCVPRHGCLYSFDTLQQHTFTVHAVNSVDFAVTETYDTNKAPGRLPGDNRRTFHLGAGGIEIASDTWVTDPSDTRAPSDCSYPSQDGQVQGCTTAEQDAATNFWYTMLHSGVGISH